MKKLFLILGIVVIIVSVIALLFALLNWHGYHSLRDGTPQHYDRLHSRAITLFWVGLALALTGAGLIVLYFKL